MLRPALPIVCLLFVAFSPLRAEPGWEEAKAAAGREPAGDRDGPRAIKARVALYLERHGEGGRIEPGRRLRAIAEDYTSRRAVVARGKSVQTIGGTRWISLGPTNGAGRMTSIAPHPTAPGTLYVGAAGGGVWKTEDAGESWTPLTEDLSDLSVGALAVAPSSPDLLYLGTGEGGLATGFIPGIGLLSSADGGRTWTLPSSVVATSFYQISVHPTRPQELVAGTNAGGIRSTDGGRTWQFVIAPATYGDVTDLVRSTADPQTLYAATWCLRGCTAGVARVLQSTDGGVSWTTRSTGLPTAVEDPVSERLSLAISPSDPTVLYAATALADAEGENSISHVYKSMDGGASWVDLPSVFASPQFQIRRFMADQSWYNNAIVVSPTDPDTVVAGGTDAIRSSDGGASWQVIPRSEIHVDHHDLRYQGSTLYFACDGGIWSSPDSGGTVSSRNAGLVTRQYYALSNDLANRSRILAGSQDNGTDQRQDGGGTSWRDVVGADGFECAVSPDAPNVAYATIQFGSIFRTKDAAGPDAGFVEISPPYGAQDVTPFHTVLALTPGRPATLYTGSSRVWRSDDAGDHWTALPTTTLDGSVWGAGSPIRAIAVAPSDAGVVLVAQGRDVFRSMDAGNRWKSARRGLPLSSVNNLEIDPRDPSVAWAALATLTGVSVYRTADGGDTWVARSAGLPRFAAHVVRVDPTDSDVLFCGTDVGVYRSTDQGLTWSRFGTGLPAVSVHDLRITEDASIVRAATYGRGVWELEVPPDGNTAPAAMLLAPGESARIARGETVLFTSRLSDADGGPVSGTWTFPDTWETLATRSAEETLAHTFRRTGVFPVSLTARDFRGATGSRFVQISVPESCDACASPRRLPGIGPFPATVLLNNEAAETAPGDPIPDCLPFAGAGVFRSLWLEFTPASSGVYEISTCGSGVDSVLSVFTGPACGPYVPVAAGCNDDAPFGSICGGTASVVTIAAGAGETLRVQVTGFFPWDASTLPVTIGRAPESDAAPRVTGITSYFGPELGGTSLRISGAGFADGARVSVGGVAARDVVLLSPGLLQATAPAHPPGLADVAVTNPDGQAGVLLQGYEYVPARRGPCVGGSAPDCSGPRDPRDLPPRS